MHILVCLLFFMTACQNHTPDAMTEEHSEAQQFIGTWKVENSLGDSFDIQVYPDGSATSNWDEGEEGSWSLVNGRLYLEWDNGWNDVIFLDEGHYSKIAYAPGMALTAPPISRAKAEKVISTDEESAHEEKSSG